MAPLFNRLYNKNAVLYKLSGWLPKFVQMVWNAKSGPNLDQIWTKSRPNLDTIWTGFSKMAAKIPGKILCPRTRELSLASASSEKFKLCLNRNCVRTREGGT